MDSAALKKLIALCPWGELAINTKQPEVIPFVTGPVRLTFAWLETIKKYDVPRKNAKGETIEGEYQACFIVPPESDLAVMSSVVGRVAAQKFGPNWQSMQLSFPCKPQAGFDKTKFKGFGDSGIFMSSASIYQPAVWDAAHKVQLPVERKIGAVYNGMWVRAVLGAYPYAKSAQRPMSKNGVGFRLMELQKLADDEPFASTEAKSFLGGVDGIEAHQAPAAMPGLAGLPGM